MNKKIEEARRSVFKSMGYTECQPGQWLKPVGFQCFGFNEYHNQWSNWYMTMSGKIKVYETKYFTLVRGGLLITPEDASEYQDGDAEYMLRTLKEWECWTKTDLHTSGSSKFELGMLMLDAVS